MKYKTPEAQRLRAKTKRDAIKTAGGVEYEDLLARERASRAKFRARRPGWYWDPEEKRKDRPGFHKQRLVQRARRRGRDAGMEATIRISDITWPSHCPVLGIELDYGTRCGSRTLGNPAGPSLDRWDNTKGYVAGNVFVISYRANALKGNATAEELDAVARYARHGPGCVAEKLTC